MITAMVTQLGRNGGYGPKLEGEERQPLCMDEDSVLEGQEERLPVPQGDPARMCGMCQVHGDEESSGSESGEGESASGDHPRAEYGTAALSSRTEIPNLLALLVNNVEKGLARDPQCELEGPGSYSAEISDTHFTSEGLKAMRQGIRDRVEDCARLTLTGLQGGRHQCDPPKLETLGFEASVKPHQREVSGG